MSDIPGVGKLWLASHIWPGPQLARQCILTGLQWLPELVLQLACEWHFMLFTKYLLTFVLCWIGFCYMKYSSVSLALVVFYLNIGTIWYMSFDSMEQLWLKIVEELDFWLSKHIQKLLAISTRSLPTPVIYSDHRWMWRGNTCLCLCVCLSVCAVRALTFECLDLQTAFMVYSYSFGIFRSRFSIKSWHWDKVRVVWA